MPASTLDLEGGWIVRSHIGWGGERNILYESVETSPKKTRYKTVRGRTISTSGGLGLLHYLGRQNVFVNYTRIECLLLHVLDASFFVSHQIFPLKFRFLNSSSDPKSGRSENGRQSWRNVTIPHSSVIGNGPEGTGRHGYKMVTETKGTVNEYECPRSQTQLNDVNNCTESLSMESQPKSVNNHKSGLGVENHYEDHLCDELE